MKMTHKTISTVIALSMSLVGFAQALSEREGLDIYQRGLYLEAIEYWKKAAAAGDAGSAYRLSEEFFDAKIVKRDIKLALKYLQQASKGNDARALTDLASMYDYGTGVKKDRKKAAKLYLRAANMGMPAAMFNVAAMLGNRRWHRG
jgi:TPR repeat protein